MARKGKSRKGLQKNTLAFDDSVNAVASTTKTEHPREASARDQYWLTRRSVKFINIRIGEGFMLNGEKWRKTTFQEAIICKDPSAEIYIDPATFVFPV